jgi:tetratricopeptide (TPR) repeat protein
MSTTGTLRDRYDMALGTASPAAATAYGDGLDRLLAMHVGAADRFTEAVAADDGFALAHAALAVGAFRAARYGAAHRLDEARTHAARAEALAGGLGRRERQHVAAVAALVAGDAPRARRLMREHLADFPRDALLLWTLGLLLGVSGAADWPAASLALYRDRAPDYGEDWWFLGQYSFFHHEVGHFAEALRLGDRALALRPDHTQAAHSVAHVHYETDAHAAGAHFVADWLAAYAGVTAQAGHLTWHRVLHELALGHEREAIALYERGLDPRQGESPSALPDTASFLWRWRIYGLGEGAPPWAPVAEVAGREVTQPGRAFIDAHAALAYAGAGEEAALARLIDGLRARAAGGDALVAEVTLPLIEGVAAFGQGDYAAAVGRLEPIADQVVRIGGSHAQREVFEDTLIQAQLRAGQTERAAARLRRRLEHRHSARDAAWLGQATAAG